MSKLDSRQRDWRQITLQVLDGSASPPPANIAADMLDDVLRYGGAAHYLERQFTAFNLTWRPTTSFATLTRYCINSDYYRAIGRLAIWEAVQDSAAPVRYRVSITSLNFQTETGNLPPQRVYLESFRRDGSFDYGPMPTNHF